MVVHGKKTQERVGQVTKLYAIVIPNCFHFAKDNSCKICGAASSRYPCNARKYTAFKGDKAYVFHIVKHICAAKPKADTVSNYVENVLKINPTATAASIQSTAIISDIR